MSLNAHEPTVQELFDLSGQVALITGGTGYLGTAFSHALAEAGASVVVASRTQARADEGAASLPVVGDAKHFGVTLDHKNDTSTQDGFNAAVEAAGQVDILINNGQSGAGNDLTDATREDFESHLANASAYFVLARMLRDHVVGRSAAGNIVMIGSMYGMVASYPDAYDQLVAASPVGYHALKGGVIHMTRHLAIYWAGDKVRVNCLSPGPFPSENVNQEMVARLCTKSPLGRMGLPYELKGALLYLASSASSYTTGQNLVVDGGWTSW